MADEKVRFQMRISPETDQKVTAAMKLTNSQSKNEFVENALIFYCGYLPRRIAAIFCRQHWSRRCVEPCRTAKIVLLACCSKWLSKYQ